MPAIETSALTIGDVSSSGKGARTCPILPATLWSPGELQVLWQPKAYDGSDANRVSISFQPTHTAEKELLALEAWVLATVTADKRFFQDVTPAQIRERFVSCLKVSDKGLRSIRAKMNFTGRGAVRCWDQDRSPCPQPQDWPSCSVTPRFHIKGLWMMSRDWGLLIELTDALVTEYSAECPF